MHWCKTYEKRSYEYKDIRNSGNFQPINAFWYMYINQWKENGEKIQYHCVFFKFWIYLHKIMQNILYILYVFIKIIDNICLINNNNVNINIHIRHLWYINDPLLTYMYYMYITFFKSKNHLMKLQRTYFKSKNNEKLLQWDPFWTFKVLKIEVPNSSKSTGTLSL